MTKRRCSIKNRLLGVMRRRVPTGLMFLSVGPRFSTTQLLRLSELKEKCAEFSVSSACDSNEYVPIDAGRYSEVFSVADGLASIPKTMGFAGAFAGTVDIYGNLALVVNILDDDLGLTEHDRGHDAIKNAPQRAEKPLGVFADHLFARVIALIRASHSLYSSVGFVGLLQLDVSVIGIRNTPLVLLRQVGFAPHRHIASCQFDDDITVAERFSTTDLTQGFQDLLFTIVQRVIWAWGLSNGADVERVVDYAERLHFGSSRCKCNLFDYPLNHKECLSCRKSR